ncbi:MAG: type II secretion system protein GspG [Pirellulales bacterium]
MLAPRRSSSRRPTRNAFTLLEVLLVLAILVVLASLAVGVFGGIQKKSRLDAAKHDVAEISSACTRYKFTVGQWPQQLEDLKHDPGVAGWAGPYLEKDQFVDPWGQEYQIQGADEYDDKYIITSSGPPGGEPISSASK